ncbi:hypothetical protein P030_00930 [Anaplasma phagocytophilum str. CRT35]|nr:hypothetical protein P030_00930 [Anaplasma phagocytophilum str. CRT35]
MSIDKKVSHDAVVIEKVTGFQRQRSIHYACLYQCAICYKTTRIILLTPIGFIKKVSAYVTASDKKLKHRA